MSDTDPHATTISVEELNAEIVEITKEAMGAYVMGVVTGDMESCQTNPEMDEAALQALYSLAARAGVSAVDRQTAHERAQRKLEEDTRELLAGAREPPHHASDVLRYLDGLEYTLEMW